MPGMGMNFIEIATKHPTLLERLLAKSTGALGEILVADALTARGYSVEPTNNNARQKDLLVTSPSGTAFSIEVKADRQRRPTWFVRTCPDPDVSTIWCLVSAPRKATALPQLSDAEFYVLTVEEARTIWQSSDWNKRNPMNGDIRRWQVPEDALEAWHKLPD